MVLALNHELPLDIECANISMFVTKAMVDTFSVTHTPKVARRYRQQPGY